MHIHHLNCGCMCPLGGALFDGFSRGLTAHLVWQYYQSGGEPWFGFEAVRELAGLPPEILLIPLPGHTRGHAGVAIATDSGWLLHAGDAYFYRHEMNVTNRHCTLGLQAYQWMMEVDRQTRLQNQDRLFALARDRAADVKLFCSHDAIEFQEFAQQPNRLKVPTAPNLDV